MVNIMSMAFPTGTIYREGPFLYLRILIKLFWYFGDCIRPRILSIDKENHLC